MRFFASWWERVPARHIGPALVTALALEIGYGSALEYVKYFVQPIGNYWT